MASEIPPLLSASPPPMCEVDFSDDELENDNNQCNDDSYSIGYCLTNDSNVGDYFDCSYNASISHSTNKIDKEDISILNYTEQKPNDEIVPDDTSAADKNKKEITQFAIRTGNVPISEYDNKNDDNIGCNEFKDFSFSANTKTKTTLSSTVNESVDLEKTNQRIKQFDSEISSSLAPENVTIINTNNYFAFGSIFSESFKDTSGKISLSVISESEIDIAKESSDFNSEFFGAYSGIDCVNDNRLNTPEANDLQFTDTDSSCDINLIINTKPGSNHAETVFSEKSFVECREINSELFSTVEYDDLDNHSKCTEEDTQTENDIIDSSDDLFPVTLNADLNTKVMQIEGQHLQNSDLIYERNNENHWSYTSMTSEDHFTQKEAIFDCSALYFTKFDLGNEDEDDFSDFVSPTNLFSRQPKTLPCYSSADAKPQTNYANRNVTSVNTFVDVNNEVKCKSICNSKTDYWNEIFHSQHWGEIEVNVNSIEGKLNGSSVWCKIKDVQTSPALNYSWNDSEANKILLSALYVDSRNILFGPRWSSEVPRFASNLGFTPLIPQKALSKDNLRIVGEMRERQIFDKPMKASGETPALYSTISSVPDAHFDWNNSGLTNPLDCYSHSSLLDLDLLANFDIHSPYYKKRRKTDKSKEKESQDTNYGSSVANVPHMKELSEEAVKILNILPNFIVMEKQYIVFPIR